MSTPARDRTDLPARALHWYRRFPVAVFLAVLTLAVVTSPCELPFRGGDAVALVRWTVVMLFGLLALTDSRRTLLVGLVLVAPALLGNWVNQLEPELAPVWSTLLPGLVFFGYVVLQLLRFILRAPRVDSEVLCAGVAGYLMLGLSWSLAYVLVEATLPGSFHFGVGPPEHHVMRGFNAIYFSFITLATIGYGDVVPRSNPARVLALTEGLAGTLYMALLISRLVTLYASSREADGADGQGT